MGKDDSSRKTQPLKLAIKLNDNPAAEPCPLCGGETNPNIGPELTLADAPQVVCHACGLEHAPALVALLTLAFVARDFYLCEQDYGDLWRAANSPQPRGLNWNEYAAEVTGR